MHALLRCDASRSSGVGHVARALAVREAALRAGWTVDVSSEASPASLAMDLLDEAGVHLLPPVHRGAELAELAVETSTDVVHVDHYSLPSPRHALSAVGVLLSSVEDETYGRRDADVVLDPGMASPWATRPADGSTILLRGLRFCLLRERALEARLHRQIIPVTERGDGLGVLVVMGGTDAAGALEPLTRSLTPVVEGGHSVTMLVPADVGSSLTASATAANINVLHPTAAVMDLMRGSDLVVSAAGTTMWELACIGVPMALLQVAENQAPGYDAMVADGAAFGLGQIEHLRADPIAVGSRLIAVLDDPDGRAAAARRGATLVDGRGARRLVAVWDALRSSTTDFGAGTGTP
jgi:spore coat polysaccharide biosynthesis predicted glycosyltransferase SpsG